MSVREFTPLFSWGFSLRRSQWLIPLFNNNLFTYGSSAVNGPYGRKNLKRNKSSSSGSNKINGNKTDEPSGIDSSVQKRDTHTATVASIKSSIHESSTAPTTSSIDPTHFDITKDMLNYSPISNLSKNDNTINGSKSTSSKSISIQQETTTTTTTIDKVKKQKEDQVAVDYKSMSDGQILDLLLDKKLAQYKLESVLQDIERAVKIRRMFFASEITSTSSSKVNSNLFQNLPYKHYDYSKVYGVCCENVVGYIPLPVGIVGPIKIDGEEIYVPMATCEGALVASTQRGAKALFVNGISAVILNDGMTRGPACQMPNAKRCAELKQWIIENFDSIAKEFNSTSRFARLSEIKVAVAGRKCFLRFKCSTGDAMGMNMVSKAVTNAMMYIKDHFEDLETVAISGNYCVDKKPSAINWIDGRGKSVVCDAVIPKAVVEKQLHTNVDKVVDLCNSKNLVGSALAGSLGGNNAHASNIVTAIFLATGQDPAQNVESSNCMTLMEKTKEGDLYISVTMPSLEVGTVGGGTHLDAQSSCLDIIGCKGANSEKPGENAKKLAKSICSTVMAGELSLLCALASGDLVSAHMNLNRKK